MPRFDHAACLAAGVSLVMLSAPIASAQPPAAAPTTQASAQPPAVYTPTSLAVAADVPRTKDGHPDLQGAVWGTTSFTYLANAGGPNLTVPKEQQKALFDRLFAPFTGSSPTMKVEIPLDAPPTSLPLVRSEYRTRLLVLPASGVMPFTDAAKKELAVPMQDKIENPEERSYMERCLFADEPPPRANMVTLGAREFVEAPGYLTIHTENDDKAQIIPFAGSGQAAQPSYQGQSLAYWEGDTLVVETTGMSAAGRRRFLPAFIVNADARVIEKYTRISKDELLYQFTVEDPKVYAAPWLAEYSLYRMPYRMYASSCHEDNRSIANILRGQRVAEEKAAAKARSPG